MKNGDPVIITTHTPPGGWLYVGDHPDQDGYVILVDDRGGNHTVIRRREHVEPAPPVRHEITVILEDDEFQRILTYVTDLDDYIPRLEEPIARAYAKFRRAVMSHGGHALRANATDN